MCQGKGKLKTIKTLVQIGPYHLGKEEYKDDCFFCNVQNTFKEYGEDETNLKKTLH